MESFNRREQLKQNKTLYWWMTTFFFDLQRALQWLHNIPPIWLGVLRLNMNIFFCLFVLKNSLSTIQWNVSPNIVYQLPACLFATGQTVAPLTNALFRCPSSMRIVFLEPFGLLFQQSPAEKQIWKVMLFIIMFYYCHDPDTMHNKIAAMSADNHLQVHGSGDWTAIRILVWK